MSKYKEYNVNYELFYKKEVYTKPLDVSINGFKATDVYIKELNINNNYIVFNSFDLCTSYSYKGNSLVNLNYRDLSLKVIDRNKGNVLIKKIQGPYEFDVAIQEGDKIKIRPSKAQKKRDKQKKKDIKKAKEKLVLDSFGMFCNGLLTHKEYEAVLDSIIDKSEEDCLDF